MIHRSLRSALPVLAGVLLFGTAAASPAGVTFGINIGPQPLPPPPPPRAVVQYAPPGPGAAWVGGQWDWSGTRWVWVPGYWDYPPTPDGVWVPGASVFIDGRYVWRGPHWDHRGWDRRGSYGHGDYYDRHHRY